MVIDTPIHLERIRFMKLINKIKQRYFSTYITRSAVLEMGVITLLLYSFIITPILFIAFPSYYQDAPIEGHIIQSLFINILLAWFFPLFILFGILTPIKYALWITTIPGIIALTCVYFSYKSSRSLTRNLYLFIAFTFIFLTTYPGLLYSIPD